MPNLPTVAIVAGAWQSPDNYGPLRDALARLGYESVCQAAPSTSLPHGDTDLDTDIAFVHDSVLLPLVKSGKEVIVVLHSFAGVYGGGAVKGLSRTEYAQNGEPGGVIAVVYVAGPCVPSGISTLQLLGIGPDLVPWVSLDRSLQWQSQESTGLLSMVDPVSLLFHKLPAPEAQSWAANMKRQAIKPLQGIVPYAPFEDDLFKGHLAYLRCAEDECVHPPAQAKFIAAAGIQETDELPTSHMPWLEMADTTAEKIIAMAERVRM
ncbi:alpha/beta hydrolase [Aspergillus lucknowensis]|uniref:AB hydrolase-1 domain-containing protein n=1 Tax=Aspergillus lucknowensis TaxID=176173 RepID=A0ABR4M4V8_9EURO